MIDYNSKYKDLTHRLRSTRRKEKLFNFSVGLFNAVSITIIVLFLITALEAVANGDRNFRTVLASILLVSFVASTAYFLYPWILTNFVTKYKQNLEKIAIRIGNYYPDIKDQLCNVMQLISNLNKKYNTSDELAIAAFSDVFQAAQSKDFDVIIDKQRIKRTLIIFFSSLIISSAVFTVWSSSFGAALNRIINFNQSFLPPAPFTLTLEPLNQSVVRDQPVVIKVTAQGIAPEYVTLYLKEEQQENFDKFNLRLDSGGVYIYKIPALKQSVSFYAEAMWYTDAIRTEEGTIKVVDKPQIRSLSGNITFPQYTHLSPREFNEQNADITALRGSNVKIDILSNKELKEARIVLEKQKSFFNADFAKVFDNSKDSSKLQYDTVSYNMSINGKRASGSFSISANANYYISLVDVENETNDNPIKYSIVALNDDYPTISFLQPQMDVQVSEEALLPLIVSISDDYGFSYLKLHYRLTSSNYTEPQEKFQSITIPLLVSGNSTQVQYLWDLQKLNISPEDRYEFYVEVYDNDIITGPKSSKTRTLTVRLPSLDEVLQEADDGQQKIENELNKMLKKADDIKKDIDDLNRDLLKKNDKNLSWKEKKKIEDIMKKQQDIQSKMADMQQDLDKITQSLDENNAISPETMEKYKELQKLMQEVSSPELKAMQQKMQQAMQNMTPEQIQKALSEHKFDEERFRKSIERTLKILKRLQAEQKVDALNKRAEELAKKQDELTEKTNNSNPNDQNKRNELAQEQNNLKKDLKDIENEMKDLESLMKELGKDMPLDELSEAKDELNPNETSQEMQNSQNSMKNGDFNKSKQSQKKASSNLKKFSDKMKQLKKEMDNKNNREAMKKMQKAINNMLELSKEQENLKEKIQNSGNLSTKMDQYADEQQDIQDALDNVAASMAELSEKSFAITPEMGKQMGNAMQQMSQSIGDMVDRRLQSAANAQAQAMSSLNQATMQMQSMLSQMQSSGSCSNPGGSGEGSEGQGSGFSERLQQLSGQQQGINQAMQQLSSQGSLSPEQQAQMARLASDQGRAQQAAEKLANEQRQQQVSGKKLGLGNLDKIAQEMKEVVTDMQTGNINQETIKRQERILSRLLDATRSMNERDFEKNRESRSGKEIFRTSPKELDLSTQEGKNQALQERLKGIIQGYSKDYETLIRQYFEALQSSSLPVR